MRNECSCLLEIWEPVSTQSALLGNSFWPVPSADVRNARPHKPWAGCGAEVATNEAANPEALYGVFEQQMSELYWLGLILTGNPDQSEQALSDALNFDESSPIFESPARYARTLVTAASLRLIDRQLRESKRQTRKAEAGLGDLENLSLVRSSVRGLNRTTLTDALLAIDPFPRSALVLSLFENLPLDEISALLDADQELVRKGWMAGLAELVLQIAARVPLESAIPQ
jgi:DNA-directed RNA polymerase specialized sigma24 family protein